MMSTYLNDPTATIFLLGQRLKDRGYIEETEVYGGVTFHLYTKNNRTWMTNGYKISYPFNSKVITEISTNKAIGYDFARRHGVSVPSTVSISPDDEDLNEAKKLLERFQRIIVKPLDASLANGVTLNIKNRAGLEQAVEAARHYSSIVLAQEQVHGDELRFAIVNGKAVAALLRQTARIVGDGVRTIQQLIEDENKERAMLDKTYFEYPQLDDSLIDPELLNDKHILADQELLELSHSAMARYGASMYNVLNDVDKGYIEIVERLGSALSRDFIVVDVMVADYGTRCTPDNYWFIEFNTSPVLKLFHGTRDGDHVDIVGLVAERIDNSIQSTK